MRAASFRGNGTIVIVEEEKPRPRENQVLMEVAFCGLCGSERRLLERGSLSTPGHEVSGVIVESESPDISVGTRAVAYLPIFCGKCRYCKEGLTNRCSNRSELLGWSENWPGGYADFMVLPAQNVIPIDESVGLDHAVLLLDTIGTALHAVRLAEPVRGARTLVMGAGPLGLGAISGLRAFGAEKVYASDPIPYRLDVAAGLGAEPVKPADVGRIDEIEVIIEAAGLSMTTMEAVEMVAPGGRVVLLGENWKPWTYTPTGANMLRDSSLIRSWYFPLREFEENQQMLLDGVFPYASFVSHTFALDDLEQAFDQFFSGESAKVLCGQ